MRIRQYRSRSTACLLLTLFVTSVAPAQRRVSESSSRLFRDPPGVLAAQTAAVGSRARTPGQEKVILRGEFSDDLGRRFPVRVTLQLPELVRLEGFNPGREALAYNHSSPSRAASWVDQQLLDTFALDTFEGMLASIRAGAALQLVGLRFGPSAMPGYSGPHFDVYEVTNPPREDPHRGEWLRRYFFNSGTGLLASTQYMDESRAAGIETRFSEWQSVQGSVYPTRIERFENGRPVFTFTFHKVSAQPRQDPAAFPTIEEPVGAEEE